MANRESDLPIFAVLKPRVYKPRERLDSLSVQLSVNLCVLFNSVSCSPSVLCSSYLCAASSVPRGLWTEAPSDRRIVRHRAM